MDLCGICEQDFLTFCNFHRYWKTARPHTCTICKRTFTRVGNLRRHKKLVHSVTHPLKGGRKPRQLITQSSSVGLDESTVVEPWQLTPTSVEMTSNPTTGVENTDESVAKKPKITRPGAISRRKRCGTDIFRRDIFSLEPVKRKQKHRATEKPKQMCSVRGAPTSVKKSPVCAVSVDQGSPMSKSTQTEIVQSESRPWLSKKTIPTTPMLVLSDRRLQKTSPPVMLPLSDEESKLIIDE